MRLWDADEIAFEVVDELTDDPVVTVVVTTPGGLLTFMAEPQVRGRILVLLGLHVGNARANAVGAANLMLIADVVIERLGFDGCEIEGAVRTTGARPGRRPGLVRITRRFRPPAPRGRSPQDR